MCLKETPDDEDFLDWKGQRLRKLPLVEAVEGGILDGEGNVHRLQLRQFTEPGKEPVEVLISKKN